MLELLTTAEHTTQRVIVLASQLVASAENTYTYKMVEGPFTNFQVKLSVFEKGTGCTAVYEASGDLNDEMQAMVREGAQGAFDALVVDAPLQ